MMGTSHAVSGAAAWIALTASATAFPSLGLHPLPATAVMIGTGIAAGAALLPDADHHNATIAHSVPIAGKVAAGVIGAVSGGHRKGMHSIMATIGIYFAVALLANVMWQPEGWNDAVQAGSAVAVAACVAFAIKVLKIVKSWLPAWIIGFAVGAAIAIWAPTEFSWLPLCITVGFIAHIVGDMLTTQGVPLIWPIMIAPPRWIKKSPLRKIFPRKGAIALPILGDAGSAREWVLMIAMAIYAVWGIAATGLDLAPMPSLIR